MIQFIAQDALRASYELETLVKLYETFKTESPAAPVVVGYCKTITRMLKTADSVIAKLNLTEAKSKIERIKTNIEYWPHGHNLSQAYTLLHELHWSFITELQAVNFSFISPEKLPFFERDELFGDDVFDNFPSVRNEIKSAGNCRAADLHAGTIYYLMCVVNIGLIALASHLRVRIKKLRWNIRSGIQ